MKKIMLMALVGAVAMTGIATAQVSLQGPPSSPIKLDLPDPPEATQQLFRGDLTAEQGIGCSNGAGTSGGPNDFAVGVTATAVATPFVITSTTYNMFTNIGPGTLSFVAWAGGGSPGAELGRTAGAPPGQGNQTFSIPSPISVSSAQFFFGFNQPESNAGLRLGHDSSSGSAGTSFIRAPTCGASAFTTVDSIGFPGNWVMAAVVDDLIPVELMTLDVE